MPPKFAIPARTSSLVPSSLVPSSLVPSDQAPPSAEPPLVVPERHISLMSHAHHNAILHRTTISHSRRVSAASTISATSSISQFVDQRAQVLEAEIDLIKAYRSGLSNLKATNKIDIGEYDKTFREIESRKRRLDHESLLLKRQRKALEEDIDDEISARIGASREELDRIMEIAYSSLVTDRVMSASKLKLQRQGPKHNQSKYRERVIRYLQAQPHESVVWCHILGRALPRSSVKAAHIVPKSLESEQLSYFFGASELRVSMDKRNGLTLLDTLEECLDAGQIVIVPMPPQPEEEATRWKCLVIDHEIMDNVVLAMDDTIRFKDIHGKALEFLSNSRPAKRYLYFRFIITYLFHKRRASNLEWVEEVEAKGTLWATPGPYLRKSMLVALARRASDHYAPEAFWNGTFEESKESPGRSAAEEEILAHALQVDIDAEMDSVLEESTKEEDSKEDSESDAED
ncbi:hypothetical protein DTO021C3_5535 [Paecilomyces variotii]|nr:hypothetical protein DTO021C3_5535 [Paecilomyces variotii]KAJ9301003.1 hypothetical protein DTO217A2_7779 [Paecilomyces variotii]KAJ9367220.1 hypothetical protein DTO282E5_8068 [Paecilomyces variotii]KAJ9400165.1 hypothetical protein DTO282F9_2935 [Paecilomyces variotii]